MNNHHRLPSPEKNLLTLYPDIAKEWDYALNKGLRPEQYAPNSSKVVWWKCKKCGERWKTAIGNRKRGCGCPFCSLRSSSVFAK